MQILEKCKLLKGTKISVQPEYTKKVAADRKELRNVMMEARSQGSKAYLVYDKLKIDEKSYTAEEVFSNKEKILSKERKTCETEQNNLDSSVEEEDNTTFSTPNNNLNNKNQPFATGTIPKRKGISPIEHFETENNVNKNVSQLGDQNKIKKLRQQPVNSFFRETQQDYNRK